MRGSRLTLGLIYAAVTAVLAAWPGWAQQGFKPVTHCRLRFPQDHGAHPEYRTEWWYYTGNLTTPRGRRFGFQLTFFRSALQPVDQRSNWPDPASAWRSDQIYLAHAAISDIAEGRHLQAERSARPVHAMAGVDRTDAATTIHVYDWQAIIKPDTHILRADTGEFALELDLTAVKPLVRHGDNGFSRKGQDRQRASCYYSYTRLQATGSLTSGGTRHQVQGLAWMDHEFSTAPLQPGIVGWDWFSLQLSDHSEVMFFLLRDQGGALNPASSGTFVPASGDKRHLKYGDVEIEPSAFWTSPISGGTYPTQWRLRIPMLGLNLHLTASLKDQEMRTTGSTGVIYWEGSVRVAGQRGDELIEGAGYVEMTGYVKPFDAPM